MVPTVAGLTILSKFQNDIKTAENKVVAFCHTKVGEVKVIFDSYAAIVGQTTNYAMPGEEIKITAGIGAYSKASAPKIGHKKSRPFSRTAFAPLLAGNLGSLIGQDKGNGKAFENAAVFVSRSGAGAGNWAAC